MTVFLPRRDELSVMGFWLLQIYRYWFRGSVKMDPIPVDELGSAGGIWVVDILDSRRGDGGRRWLRGRARTGAADGTSAVVAGLSSGQAQLVSYNVV